MSKKYYIQNGGLTNLKNNLIFSMSSEKIQVFQVPIYVDTTDWEAELKTQVQSLKQDKAKLLECVEFYADKDNECCGDYQPPNRARQCLEDLGEEIKTPPDISSLAVNLK